MSSTFFRSCASALALRPSAQLVQRSYSVSRSFVLAQQRTAVQKTTTTPWLTSIVSKRLFSDDAHDAPSHVPPPPKGPLTSSTGDQSAALFVGGIPYAADERDLTEHFSRYPNFVKARIVYGADGLSRGFGYVNFSSSSDVAKVIDQAREEPIVIFNRSVRCDWATSMHSVPSRHLFLTGGNCTDEELTELVNERCPVKVDEIKIIFNRIKNQKQAFLTFTDVDGAKEALAALDGVVMPEAGRLFVRYMRDYPQGRGQERGQVEGGGGGYGGRDGGGGNRREPRNRSDRRFQPRDREGGGGYGGGGGGGYGGGQSRYQNRDRDQGGYQSRDRGDRDQGQGGWQNRGGDEGY